MRRAPGPAAAAAAALLALAGCHGARGGAAAQGGLAVSHAVVPVPTSRAEASAFMVIENRGAAVTLIGATSPDAESVRLERDIGGQMGTVQGIDIPAGGRMRLVPGSYHLMLEKVARALAVGDTVTLRLNFAPGATLTVRAPLLTYTDAISDLPVR